MITNEMALKLANEIEKLRVAIRKHRDQRGDDRCWMDDEERESSCHRNRRLVDLHPARVVTPTTT